MFEPSIKEMSNFLTRIKKFEAKIQILIPYETKKMLFMYFALVSQQT